MRVEIWSDVVCPWCYIGKRRFETAIAGFEHGDQVEVLWRSFELDPRAAQQAEGDPAERLAAKYGMTVERARAAQAHVTATAAVEGLVFRFDQSKGGNTFDAHRLLHLAADRCRQDEVKERLMAGYFTEGEAIGDRETLIRLVSQAGIDAEEARAVIEGDKYADAVRDDERAAQEAGANAVPFFLIDRRYAIEGAQPAEVLLEALRQAWSESRPVVVEGAADVSCDGDSCAV